MRPDEGDGKEETERPQARDEEVSSVESDHQAYGLEEVCQKCKWGLGLGIGQRSGRLRRPAVSKAVSLRGKFPLRNIISCKSTLFCPPPKAQHGQNSVENHPVSAQVHFCIFSRMTGTPHLDVAVRVQSKGSPIFWMREVLLFWKVRSGNLEHNSRFQA